MVVKVASVALLSIFLAACGIVDTEQAQAAIESEKKAAVADIKNQVAELSVEIAEKVLKEQLANKDKQLKLVESMLGDVKLN